MGPMSDGKHIPGSSVLLTCSCKSPYEDELYGHGQRGHNVMGSGTQARCATCSNERPISGSMPKGKK